MWTTDSGCSSWRVLRTYWQCVLIETTPHEDGTRLYWFGVASSNAYYFMLEVAQPVDIFAVSSWFYAQQAMLEAHDKDNAFCDMQGELPF